MTTNTPNEYDNDDDDLTQETVVIAFQEQVGDDE